MNIYEDLFNEDGSVKDAVVLATAEAITSDTPVSSAGTYVLEGVREADGYPEDFVGKCLLVVSGTTQPLDTNYVLFANSIIWYKSAKDSEWSKDSGYTNAEYDQMADLRAIISQIRNDIASLKDSFNNTMQVKIDGLLDGKGKLKMSIMPDLLQHNRGIYANEAEITKSVANPVAGDWVINTTTDTVWVYDAETSKWVDSDRKGQVTSVNGKTGAVTITDPYAVVSKGAANLNTLVTQGNYYVNTSCTNGPAAINGLVQVYQITSDYIRQVFWRLGTINSNEYCVYTREFNKTTSTFGPWYQLMTNKGGTFTGAITATSVSSTGNITATGSLTAKGVSSTAAITATGNITSSGAITATGNIASSGNVTVSGSLLENWSAITKGTNPSSTTYKTPILVLEGTGKTATTNRISMLASSVDANGTVNTYITSYKHAANTSTGASVGVRYPLSGTATGYAPNPAANSDTNDIATTAWVRDKFAISIANPSGGTDGDFWFKV